MGIPMVAIKSILRTAVLIACAIQPLSVPAQEALSGDVNLTEAARPDIPEDAFDRGTPRRAVEGFLNSIEARDLEAAAEYLDLRNLPRRYRNVEPAELARELGVVLNREVWVNLTELSDEPDGKSGDGLPSYRDELGRVQTEQGEIVLLLQRVPRGDGVSIWKVSNATVAKTADLYDDFGYGRIVEAVAKRLPDVSFLGLELFKWVLALGSMVLAYPVLYVLAWLVTRFRRTEASPTRRRIFLYLVGPVSAVIIVMIGNIVVLSLGLGVTARRVAEGKTVMTLVITWLILATISLIRDVIAYRLEQQGREGALVLLRPAAAAVNGVILVCAILVWLDNIGFDITALLASLGVGGVAVALALQRPLEDVVGAFTLYTQQPIRIGDFCRFGGQTGTVEEIGLRTTRLRTLNNTVVSVPNAKFAGEYLENISARQKILYRHKMRLRYDTDPDVVEKVLADVRDMLTAHPRVIQDAPRVRFLGFGTDALEMEIFAYLATTSWPEYLELAEEINIKVLDIIKAAGTSLAPSLLVENI
jgi:MscS family membrane protein